jgi:NADH-ubiquinone oxidoreductase chain 5
VIFIGLITILISLLASILEKDLKKIIALSTLRHLGFIVTLIGLGRINAAFVHIIIHAFFKALLFITIGIIIHSFKDYQRFYIISSALEIRKLNSFFLIISVFRLCGLPFLSGFYSKDLGLEIFMGLNSNILTFLSTIALSLSSMVYSTRIIKHIIFSSKKLTPIF